MRVIGGPGVLDTEWLFGFVRETEGDGRRKTFRYLREISAVESARSRAAEALLARMTAGSPLADLRTAQSDLMAEVGWLEAGGVTGNPAAGAGRKVQKEFKAWLSAFKSFDDRTSAWLSRDYGQESAVYQAFKRLLSHEFDANFAYRLCSGLRNAAEHQGDVLNDIHLRRGRVGDGREVEHEVVVRLNVSVLADRFPKIRSATREEMRTATEPLEVELVVGAVGLSCERVHAGLLMALSDELDGAATVVEGFHGEALAAGGEWAMFIPDKSVEGLHDNPRGQLNLRWNRYELAELVRRNRAQVDAVLSVPSVPLHWRDLVASVE